MPDAGDVPPTVGCKTTMTTIAAPNLSELTTEQLGLRIDALITKVEHNLKELMPLVLETWKRLEAGESVLGCSTKTEFSEKVLHKTLRAVQYMLNGGNHNRTEYARRETVSPITSECPVCFEILPSKTQYGRHIRSAHPEHADKILGLQAAPPPPLAVEPPRQVCEVLEEESQAGGSTPIQTHPEKINRPQPKRPSQTNRVPTNVTPPPDDGVYRIRFEGYQDANTTTLAKLIDGVITRGHCEGGKRLPLIGTYNYAIGIRLQQVSKVVDAA